MILHGDLGTSIFTNLPVSHMIAQRIEPTLSLMVLTLVFSVVVAIPLGVLAAWKHGSWIDRGVMALAVFGFSTPVFVVGYVLAYLFALQLDWLPVQGFTLARPRVLAVPAQPDPAHHRAGPGLHRAAGTHHAGDDAGRAEPGLCAHREGEGGRPARDAVRARVEERRSADRHHHRHRFALLIGGAVVTESVFAIPGLGRLTVDAILRRDYPVIQGVVLLFSFVYVLVNLRGRPALHPV